MPEGQPFPTEEVVNPGPDMGMGMGFDEPKTVISIYVENMYLIF